MRVKELELKIFGKENDQQLITDRIERLEEKVFGQKQKGPLHQRLDALLISKETTADSISQLKPLVPLSDVGSSSPEPIPHTTAESAPKPTRIKPNGVSQLESVIPYVPSVASAVPSTAIGKKIDPTDLKAVKDWCNTYNQDLTRKVNVAWFPPKLDIYGSVFVVFNVDKTGVLSNLRIDQSSGLAAVDQAALKAVENSAPFRPFADNKNLELLKIKMKMSGTLTWSGISSEARSGNDLLAEWTLKHHDSLPSANQPLRSKTINDVTAFVSSVPSLSAPSGASASGVDLATYADENSKAIKEWAETYSPDLTRRIKRAWFPPKLYESKRVALIFKIDKDGNLSNLRVDRSSGVSSADQAALKAVENAAPFRPLHNQLIDPLDVYAVFDRVPDSESSVYLELRSSNNLLSKFKLGTPNSSYSRFPPISSSPRFNLFSYRQSKFSQDARTMSANPISSAPGITAPSVTSAKAEEPKFYNVRDEQRKFCQNFTAAMASKYTPCYPPIKLSFSISENGLVDNVQWVEGMPPTEDTLERIKLFLTTCNRAAPAPPRLAGETFIATFGTTKEDVKVESIQIIDDSPKIQDYREVSHSSIFRSNDKVLGDVRFQPKSNVIFTAQNHSLPWLSQAKFFEALIGDLETKLKGAYRAPTLSNEINYCDVSIDRLGKLKVQKNFEETNAVLVPAKTALSMVTQVKAIPIGFPAPLRVNLTFFSQTPKDMLSDSEPGEPHVYLRPLASTNEVEIIDYEKDPKDVNDKPILFVPKVFPGQTIKEGDVVLESEQTVIDNGVFGAVEHKCEKRSPVGGVVKKVNATVKNVNSFTAPYLVLSNVSRKELDQMSKPREKLVTAAIQEPEDVRVLMNVNFESFMANLKKQIVSRWPRTGGPYHQIKMQFNLSPYGDIVFNKFSSPPGYPGEEELAFQTIKSAAPYFGLPPKGMTDNVDIEFTFPGMSK